MINNIYNKTTYVDIKYKWKLLHTSCMCILGRVVCGTIEIGNICEFKKKCFVYSENLSRC